MKDTFEIRYRKIPVEVSIKGIDKIGHFQFFCQFSENTLALVVIITVNLLSFIPQLF